MRSPARRLGRIVAFTLLGVLGLVLLLLGGVLVWLHTGSGSSELGRLVTNKARESIQGDLQVRDVQLRGFVRVCADGVTLKDPDGHKALSADRACVSLSPLALKRKIVKLTEVELINPWIELATVQDKDGKPTTTLARALAARNPKEPSKPSGPFEYVVDLQNLKLRGGQFAVRPAPGQEATIALQDLDVPEARALYKEGSAAAALQLGAQLSAPGKAPVSLQLDAGLEGAFATGNATLRDLKIKLGNSGLEAQGSWDLAKQAGHLHVKGLHVTPHDLETFVPGKQLIAGDVSGEADLKSDGKTAQLALHLEAGSGTVQATATATLQKPQTWDLQAFIDHVNPGAISPAAPKGSVTARIALHGEGVPKVDAREGVSGHLKGDIKVGPAQLEGVGPITAELAANVEGRYGLIRAFSATAFGLTLKAHGAAAREEISLDLTLDAPDLRHVARAISAFTHQKAPPLSGSLHVVGRATGKPLEPDAELRIRAPHLRFGPSLAADGLAVRGSLHGPLEAPDGSLRLEAGSLELGSLKVAAPQVSAQLEWPVAHLRIDAGVQGGALLVAGDARIDEDKDGLVLSGFTVSYPGNELKLTHPVSVHFAEGVVLEPLELAGEHGSLRLAGQLKPGTPGHIDATAIVSKFDLAHLPEFALPKDLGLHGVVDASVLVQGRQDAPDLDLKADVRGAGAARAGALSLDAHTIAHIHAGRLKAEGTVNAPGVLALSFKGEVPVQKLAAQPASTPISFSAELEGVNLGKLADQAKLSTLQKQRLQGQVSGRFTASGTLGAPRAVLSLAAHGVSAQRMHDIDLHAGLLLEKDKAVVDGNVALSGDPAVAFKAETPFELARALRDPAYARGALERALTAQLAVTKLRLERLAQAGILPEGSAGEVTLGLRLAGTLQKPELHAALSGEGVSVGRLHELGVAGQLDLTERLKLALTALSQGEVVARLDATLGVDGAELLAAAANKDDQDALATLLDRSVSLTLDIPGLPIARASQLAGKNTFAEGRITGRVTLAGTPARPRLNVRLDLKDVQAQQKKLGGADFYVEADENGALVHLGVDPPGGGNLLAHATVKAELGARALLRDGVSSVLDGQINGDVTATNLDLAFLSGLAPNVRHAGGTLNGAVKLAGVVSKPTAEGEAHLQRGLFDVVGQGVYEDVGLDATFSPKEVVIDRLTGSTGPGTFSAVLVAARRPSNDPDVSDKLEFTGEVHLGDDESVRDRKLQNGKPLSAGAVPVRQAGEQRLDVTGELDIFGDYADSLLTVNAKIPEARVNILQLPSKKLPGLKPNPDVILVHPGEKPHPPGIEPEEADAEAQARATATFRAHAHLDLIHLYVKAPDFEFPVESAMNFDYDAHNPDEPTADGTVHVPQGSFTALGRRFEIVDALITETGGEIEDPELEVKARFENPKAVVTITVSGSAKDPQLEMTSNPAMDQDAIAFFLATGRIQGQATQSGGGVDLSSAATSVLGGLLFGQIRKQLADVLPVDVLTIETGDKGVSQASVGKYIGDRIFIGYRQRLAAAPNENTSEGRIEYEVSKAVNLEATVGDKNRDVSVLYTKDF